MPTTRNHKSIQVHIIMGHSMVHIIIKLFHINMINTFHYLQFYSNLFVWFCLTFHITIKVISSRRFM